MSWDYYQPQQTTATVKTNFLCRSTGKPCPNATEYGYCKQTVCNSREYEITYVLNGWGLKDGFVALAIKETERSKK